MKAIRSGVTTKYIYDNRGRLLAEADNSGNIIRYYIYGNGLLAAVTPANSVYCYPFNGVGSTVAITDSTQAIVNKYAYDPFGNIASQSETVMASQPFKYVGQYGVMAEPNRLYYMRARYYDPAVGRFISEDPIGFNGGDTNLMAYVANNPVNFVDPWGLASGYSGLISDGLMGGGGIALSYGIVTGNFYIIVGGSVAIGIGAAIKLYDVYTIPDQIDKIAKPILDDVRKQQEESDRILKEIHDQNVVPCQR